MKTDFKKQEPDLKLDEVVEATKFAVSDYGEDWIDPRANMVGETCVYNYELEGKTRHCIIGHVLDQFGIEIPEGCNSDTGIDMLVEEMCIACEPEALEFMVQVQNVQDNGKTWKQALDHGLKYLEGE